MNIPGFTAEMRLSESKTDYETTIIRDFRSNSEVIPSVMCKRFRFCLPRYGCCDCIDCGGGRWGCVCSNRYAV